jgi:hypothetical protein
VWNVVENIDCPGVYVTSRRLWNIRTARIFREWKVESLKLSVIIRSSEIESYHRHRFRLSHIVFFYTSGKTIICLDVCSQSRVKRINSVENGGVQSDWEQYEWCCNSAETIKDVKPALLKSCCSCVINNNIFWYLMNIQLSFYR